MAAICYDLCMLPCKGVGYCCMGCEKACSSTCSLCFKLNCCPEDRPSPIFLTYTLLINIPLGVLALVLGITAFVNNVTDNPGCNFFVHPGTWLLIAVALSAFFCLFALRIYQTFSKTATPDIEAGASHEQRTRRTFTGKLYHTCCHDVGTFLYFFVAPFTVVWAILGLARDGLDGCDESDWGVRLTSVVLLLYLGCTVFVACISCFWEMNRMANGMVAEQEQDRRHQAGPSALQEQLVASQQQYGAAPFVNHMFGPGFVNGPARPAAAPPYSHQPPVASMVKPPPGAGATYPAAAPPEGARPPSDQTAAQSPAFKQSIFDKMAAAYKR